MCVEKSVIDAIQTPYANTQDLPTRTARRFGRMILLNVIKEKKNVDYIKSFGEKSMLILGLCL